MNDIQIFSNPEFGQIRTVTIDEEPWFVGKDIATALGFTNTRDAIATHVFPDDKGVDSIDTPGGKQEMTIINESGLYALVFGSRLESAKDFKRWVTSEVLPSIRKHGGYIAGQKELTSEELMAKALIVAQNTLAERERQLSEVTVKNAIMAPKADYFDEMVNRNMLTSFRDTAKELHVKQKAFIDRLMELKYIYRDKKSKLVPYADKNDGLFEVKECFNDKTSWSGTQTMITPKGRETFRLLCQDIAEGV